MSCKLLDGIELRSSIRHLQKLRCEGIKHFHVAKVYERLQKKREHDHNIHRLLNDVVKHLQVSIFVWYHSV